MQSARHVNGAVEYSAFPPTEGRHHPVWWTCGRYDRPIPFEHAVHSMEHGAAWLTYRPGQSREVVSALERLADRDHMLLSPLPGQVEAIVATAWSVQLRLDQVDRAALEDFIRNHRLGSLAPESGALCTNGTTRDLVRRDEKA